MIDPEDPADADPDKDEETTAKPAALKYPLNAHIDEQRRAFLLEQYADPEIDIAILAPALAILEAFLKTGDVPKGKPAPKFRAVPGKEP
jgi:hypothetical protein